MVVEITATQALLTSRQAVLLLRILPKVLERMARRGEIPALKVGKFWRCHAATLDLWIKSSLESGRQPCRMKTSFLTEAKCWHDINTGFKSSESGRKAPTLTEKSRKLMPIDPPIAEAPFKFRRQEVCVGQDDYIFAGDSGKPTWQATMSAEDVSRLE